jgi:predicted transcriptional regulator
MSIRYTSHAALASLESTLTGLRLEVYTTIRAWHPIDKGPGPSIEDLATTLHRKECSICGRLNELRDLGLITEGPVKVNHTGKQALTYIAISYHGQRTLFS